MRSFDRLARVHRDRFFRHRRRSGEPRCARRSETADADTGRLARALRVGSCDPPRRSLRARSWRRLGRGVRCARAEPSRASRARHEAPRTRTRSPTPHRGLARRGPARSERRDPARGDRRCHACVGRFGRDGPDVCWDGGRLGVDEPCHTGYECARGLWCLPDSTSPDYISPGVPSTCVPLCTSDSDCARRGEVCLRQVCTPGCSREDPSSCPANTICTTLYSCFHERALADCGRDGTIDCPIGMQCARREPLTCEVPR